MRSLQCGHKGSVLLRIFTSEVGAPNSSKGVLRQSTSDTSLPNQTDAGTTAHEKVQGKRSMVISRVGRVILSLADMCQQDRKEERLENAHAGASAREC
jgi:hypothetical protein